MDSISSKTFESNKSLICPITLQTFNDPVRAGDGHVYERAAIERWISERGISPLTRQPLEVTDLRPDEHLKRLATQQRHSSVSYDAYNQIVIFLPLQQEQRSSNDSRITSFLNRLHVPISSEGSQFTRCFTPLVILLHSMLLAVALVLILTIASKHAGSG